MCKVIAFANQKGGVTKSTSTENIGIGLARLGKKVLLIDADGQGSLTASLGFRNPDSMEVTLPTILERIIEDEEVNRNEGLLVHEEGIYLMPCNIELSALEVSMSNVMRREYILKEYVDMQREHFDFILIDCMPSLGMITVNALTAADSVIIPVQASYVFYAKKMGEKYLERYKKYFKDPIIHEQDMRHEELLGVYPEDWCKLVKEICIY